MRHYFGDFYEAYSAGTEATFVKSQVLLVLAEAGVSAEGLYSKTIEDLGHQRFETVITVCDDAQKNSHCDKRYRRRKYFGGYKL